MYSQINSAFKSERGNIRAEIFSYSSNGIPGLEIHGLKTLGKTIKEKFIYLSRKNNLKIPAKRYSLSVEILDTVHDYELDSLRSLEYPLLLSFWSLAEIIPITNLEDCFASGRISATSILEETFIPESLLMELFLDIKRVGYSKLKLITDLKYNLDDNFVSLPTSELLKNIPNLRTKNKLYSLEKNCCLIAS